MSKVRSIYIVAIVLALMFIFQITMPKGTVTILLVLFNSFCFYLYFIKKKHKPLVLSAVMTMICSVVYFNVHGLFIENTINSLTDENTKIEGYVTEINTDFSFGNRYTIKVEEINDKNANNTFVYLYSFEKLSIGKEIEAIGELNQNSFSSYSINLFSKNIYGTFNADNIIKKDTNRINFIVLGGLIQDAITDNMQKLYSGDVLALSLSMGYSDKSFVSDEILENFNISGLSHMLVVSGLHVGVICLFLNYIFKFIPIKKKMKNIVLCIALLLLAMIIGFTYSISRAVFIMVILLLLKNLKLYPDTFSSLSLIVILTLLQNPYAAVDIGLQLSYCAFIGVILGAKFSSEKGFSNAVSAVIISGFAVLFTIPVLSFSNMNMTIISPIVNPIFSLLILPVAILSFFTPIIAFIPILNPINNILVLINTVLINVFIYTADFISTIFSFSLINVSYDIFRVAIIASIVSGLIYILSFGHDKKCKYFVAFICIISIMCYNFVDNNRLRVTMIDTGRFVSSVVNYDNKVDLILKESISEEELVRLLNQENKASFNSIILCFNDDVEFDYSLYSDYIYYQKNDVLYEFDYYSFEVIDGNLFKLKSEKLTVITSKDAQKISGEGIYFLASNPPEEFDLSEIYYYQNGVLSNNFKSFINLGIGTRIYEDFKIDVNLINGEYYIVKDVVNFANWI